MITEKEIIDIYDECAPRIEEARENYDFYYRAGDEQNELHYFDEMHRQYDNFAKAIIDKIKVK